MSGPVESELSGRSPAAGRRTVALRVTLLVLAAALVALGVAFVVRASDLRDQRATTNEALVDAGRTSEAIGQISTAMNQVFSYDYARPQVARAAAEHWLTGSAPAQYTTLFRQLQQLAPGQKLTIVARVSTAGVTYLHGDHAQLLVFLDQESTRASDGQSAISAAQVRIGAVRHGGLWQIDDIDAL